MRIEDNLSNLPASSGASQVAEPPALDLPVFSGNCQFTNGSLPDLQEMESRLAYLQNVLRSPPIGIDQAIEMVSQIINSRGEQKQHLPAGLDALSVALSGVPQELAKAVCQSVVLNNEYKIKPANISQAIAEKMADIRLEINNITKAIELKNEQNQRANEEECMKAGDEELQRQCRILRTVAAELPDNCGLEERAKLVSAAMTFGPLWVNASLTFGVDIMRGPPDHPFDKIQDQIDRLRKAGL